MCHATCAGHDHHERNGLMLDGSWTNFVDYGCAYNMHFTNWFSDRLAWATVGGVDGDFVPLTQSQLADLRALYQSSKWCCTSLLQFLADGVGHYSVVAVQGDIYRMSSCHHCWNQQATYCAAPVAP
jgi:hypothetical protein